MVKYLMVKLCHQTGDNLKGNTIHTTRPDHNEKGKE